ncbi:hypothetical protein [Microbulbifer sp. JMSA003]|uniref:hypothetical protein n=1 Tax=Microbulbifer sp. JMSA003 TaxID=3243369 RepID=UPI004039CA80
MLRITITLILLLAQSHALACSCHLGSVEDKLKNAESVFIGKSREVIVLDEKNELDEDRIIVKLDVLQTFKNADSLITLDTLNNSSSCEGYWFKEGQEYLIYAYKIEDKLSTLYCGGVIPKDTNKDSTYLKELNQLKQLTSMHNKFRQGTQ